MKRKSRQSAQKAEEVPENDVESSGEQNGNDVDSEEPKKRAGRGKQQDSVGGDSENSDSELDTKKKKASKASKRALAKKAENSEAKSDGEEADAEPEPETKKKKASKASKKAAAKKAEKANDEEENENAEPEEDGGEYEVEKVLDVKFIKGVKHFLIRWKGYEPESDTWEPHNTLDCPELIAEFQKKKKPSKEGKKKGKKPAPTGTEETWDENEDFEVVKILDVYFKKDGGREFLVVWKGYPPSESTWEPEENMDCKDMIERFMSKVERAKDSTQKELRVQRKQTDRFTLNTNDSGRRLSKRGHGQQRVHYYDAE